MAGPSPAPSSPGPAVRSPPRRPRHRRRAPVAGTRTVECAGVPLSAAWMTTRRVPALPPRSAARSAPSPAIVGRRQRVANRDARRVLAIGRVVVVLWWSSCIEVSCRISWGRGGRQVVGARGAVGPWRRPVRSRAQRRARRARGRRRPASRARGGRTPASAASASWIDIASARAITSSAWSSAAPRSWPRMRSSVARALRSARIRRRTWLTAIPSSHARRVPREGSNEPPLANADRNVSAVASSASCAPRHRGAHPEHRIDVLAPEPLLLPATSPRWQPRRSLPRRRPTPSGRALVVPVLASSGGSCPVLPPREPPVTSRR